MQQGWDSVWFNLNIATKQNQNSSLIDKEHQFKIM